MNVLIISSPNDEAAGVVSYDISAALSKTNEVCLLTKSHPKGKFKFKKIIIPESNTIKFKNKYLNRFLPKTKTDPNYYFFDINESKTIINSKTIIGELENYNFVPNVILVMFYQKFLNFENISNLSKHFDIPLFFYMMDMAVITGGCHYSWDCVNYQVQCGNCPGLFSSVKNDQSSKNLMLKKNSLLNVNVSVIAASSWSYYQLKRSSLFNDSKKHKVFLPINENKFKPNKTKQLFHELGLPIEKRIIFFGSVSVNEKRKGFSYLLNALKHLHKTTEIEENKKIHLVIAGNKEDNLLKELPFTYKHVGFVNQDELAKIFNVSDLFISPSIEDSGPMMVNQSLMSGTPVVAFKTGVALDLIQNGINGYLADSKDYLDLAKGIGKIIFKKDSELSKMSKNSRKLALEQFSLELQSNKLLELFKKKLDEYN